MIPAPVLLLLLLLIFFFFFFLYAFDQRVTRERKNFNKKYFSSCIC